MITEDYVSFEVSKLLREKGFDQNCATYYLDGLVWRHCHSEVIPKGKQIYAAPTQAMTMKWLRGVHNIHIAVDRGPKGYHLSIQTIPLGVVKYITREITGNTYVNSYEEAIEAVISYCLEKLI